VNTLPPSIHPRLEAEETGQFHRLMLVMRRRFSVLTAWGRTLVLTTAAALASITGKTAAAASESVPPPVAVVYNANVAPDSRLVAEHYARVRGLPATHVIGLPLPKGETMTRAEFRAQLQEPLIQELDRRKLVSFYSAIRPATTNRPGEVIRIPVQARIRYLALCYGVPAKIAEDTNAPPPAAAKPGVPMQQNHAAVDSELALLPLLDRKLSIAGPAKNPFFGFTNFSRLHPTNGLLMVTRLDGPSASVARSLVDKAIEAEARGLCGRAYFDTRNLTESGYKRGDDWINAAATVARDLGFECAVDNLPGTFDAATLMPQIALYAGWYDGSPSGPFLAGGAEFQPGAIAYHLHSYNANTIRNASSWVGNLLASGAAATIGYVHEPFLDTTVQVGVLYSKLLKEGATFGEAAYCALPALSWQATLLGDPLYRPRVPGAAANAPDTTSRRTPSDWVLLHAVNRRLAGGDSPAQAIASLQAAPETRTSALLQQKLADLLLLSDNASRALEALNAASKLPTTPVQRQALQLAIARTLVKLKRDSDALAAYARFLKDNPKFGSLATIYREAIPLARALEQSRLAEEYQEKLDRLAPRTNPPPTGSVPGRP